MARMSEELGLFVGICGKGEGRGGGGKEMSDFGFLPKVEETG